jgi:hypothetical protein
MNKKKYKVTAEFRATRVDDPALSRMIHVGELIMVYEQSLNSGTVVFEIFPDKFQVARGQFFAEPV